MKCRHLVALFLSLLPFFLFLPFLLFFFFPPLSVSFVLSSLIYETDLLLQSPHGGSLMINGVRVCVSDGWVGGCGGCGCSVVWVGVVGLKVCDQHHVCRSDVGRAPVCSVVCLCTCVVLAPVSAAVTLWSCFPSLHLKLYCDTGLGVKQTVLCVWLAAFLCEQVEALTSDRMSTVYGKWFHLDAFRTGELDVIHLVTTTSSKCSVEFFSFLNRPDVNSWIFHITFVSITNQTQISH